MEQISVSELIQYIKENEFHLERPPQSVNRKTRYEEWMFSNNEVPPFWSNTIVNVEQPFSNGPPFLSPIAPIFDEESHEGKYRFPKDHEFDSHIIRNGVNKISGTDALAWYRPFHMEPFEKWGITILDQGIWYIARYLADEMFNVHPTEDEMSDCVDIATDFLYYHELFHFKVELATTMAELNSNNPFYKRYWHDSVFNSESEMLRGHAPLEEALANAYARNRTLANLSTTQKSKVRIVLDRFMKLQPDGYKHAYRVIGVKSSFKKGVLELIGKIINQRESTFDLNRTIIEHVFFDGPYGQDDWLDHYESRVPCRILNTGFASGRFAIKDFDFGIWCLTKDFNKGWKGFNKQEKKKFQAVCQLYAKCTNGEGLKNSQGYKKFQEEYGGNAKYLSQSDWGTTFHYFRFFGKQYRVYHETSPDGREVLLSAHYGGNKTHQNQLIKALEKTTPRPAVLIKECSKCSRN